MKPLLLEKQSGSSSLLSILLEARAALFNGPCWFINTKLTAKATRLSPAFPARASSPWPTSCLLCRGLQTTLRPCAWAALWGEVTNLSTERQRPWDYRRKKTLGHRWVLRQGGSLLLVPGSTRPTEWLTVSSVLSMFTNQEKLSVLTLRLKTNASE